VATFFSAALALIDQLQPHAGARAQQTFKAFLGLAVMIILPMLAVWWARKRYRP